MLIAQLRLYALCAFKWNAVQPHVGCLTSMVLDRLTVWQLLAVPVQLSKLGRACTTRLSPRHIEHAIVTAIAMAYPTQLMA